MLQLTKTVEMKKSNRVIEVAESQVKGYLARGYDQIDGKGKIVKEATDGKTISAAEHSRVVKELEELKARAPQGVGTDIALKGTFEKLQEDYDKLQAAYHSLEEGSVAKEDHDTLQAKYDELEVKAKEFAAKGKALQEENDKLKAKK